jgi:hypothetical protein
MYMPLGSETRLVPVLGKLRDSAGRAEPGAGVPVLPAPEEIMIRTAAIGARGQSERVLTVTQLDDGTVRLSRIGSHGTYNLGDALALSPREVKQLLAKLQAWGCE